MLELIILFFVCVGGCSLLGKILGAVLFGSKSNGFHFTDKTTHHHYYDNRSINVDKETFKNLKK